MAGPNWLKLFERTPGYPGPVTLAKQMSSKFDFFFKIRIFLHHAMHYCS